VVSTAPQQRMNEQRARAVAVEAKGMRASRPAGSNGTMTDGYAKLVAHKWTELSQSSAVAMFNKSKDRAVL